MRAPLSLDDIRLLKAGDIVWMSGTLYTARDKAHAYLRRTGNLPVPLDGAVIYHCGPLISGGRVISAGPTTSGRLSRYTQDIVSRGVRAIIGKGGLPGASDKLRGKAVYLAYTGGCGAAAAQLLKLHQVHLEELGMAEAVWEMEAKDLGPLIVAIDSYGRDLYGEIAMEAKRRLKCR